MKICWKAAGGFVSRRSGHDHDRRGDPEDQYGFRPVPGVKSVESSRTSRWRPDGRSNFSAKSVTSTAMFRRRSRARCGEQALASEVSHRVALKERGAQFRVVSGGLGSAARAEGCLPPPVPAVREDALRDALSAKVRVTSRAADGYERMLGIVPHLTRRRAANMASATAGPQRLLVVDHYHQIIRSACFSPCELPGRWPAVLRRPRLLSSIVVTPRPLGT